MIQAVSKLMVRTAELVEAEGRVVRHEAIQLIKLALYYVATSVLALLGFMVLASGVFMAMTEVMKPAYALLIIGGAFLIAGLLTFVIARQYEPRNREARDVTQA